MTIKYGDRVIYAPTTKRPEALFWYRGQGTGKRMKPGALGTVAPGHIDARPDSRHGTYVAFDGLPDNYLLVPHGHLAPATGRQLYVAARSGALGNIAKGAVVTPDPANPENRCIQLGDDLKCNVADWAWTRSNAHDENLLPLDETGNVTALLAGKFVKGTSLTEGEQIWLDERRKRLPVFMSASANPTGFVGFTPFDKPVDYWLDPARSTEWWFALTPHPKTEHAPTKKDPAPMNHGYIVCTPESIKPLLDKLGIAYPNLRWRSGNKPAGEFCTFPGPYPFMLSLDPQLAYCDPYSPEHHPGLTAENLAFATDLGACMKLAASVYGPPAPKLQEAVTRAWLVKQGACREGLAWFDASFGKAAKVSRKALRAAASAEDPSWGPWLDAHR